MRPIFIHAGLRSGSSYVWTKFRDNPAVMAFYEPFSEDLGRATRQFLLTHGPHSWRSGHTETAPYYKEYEPLLDSQGGICGFSPSFSYENYFLNNVDLPDQRRYLQSLIDLAGRQDKTAVLGFCRSLGRSAWMKRFFPDAVHIVMIRNPVDQWLSGYNFFKSTQNPYFLMNPLWCMRHPGDNKYIKEQCERLGKALSQPSLGASMLYEIFLHVYGSGTLSALAHADLVFDIDLLSRSSLYRHSIESRLSKITGIELDFSDVRMIGHSPSEAGLDFAGITARVIEDLSRCLDGQPDPNRLGSGEPWTLLMKMEISACQPAKKPAGP